MKERPILFSSEMVRAILDGRKTQTRLVVKPQPETSFPFAKCIKWGEMESDRGIWGVPGWGTSVRRCPYGQPGDCLWVRETWCPTMDGAEVAYYKATIDQQIVKGPKWKPSIHMPRWASRIALEVTGVRVERVQDISEGDAIAEGIEPHFAAIAEMSHDAISPESEFALLWDSINAKRGYSWDSNPWVWVVEFKVLNG
jgi:hypothetical protein